MTTEAPNFTLWGDDPDAADAILVLAQRKRTKALAIMTQVERVALLREATALEEKAWEFQEYTKGALASAG